MAEGRGDSEAIVNAAEEHVFKPPERVVKNPEDLQKWKDSQVCSYCCMGLLPQGKVEKYGNMRVAYVN